MTNITARDLYETEIINMPDKEFKIMIIKIHTGHKKIVEDISETLNREMKMNQSEMKNSISEIKNILDEVNGKLEEAEEWTSDLEDRVIRSNQPEQERQKSFQK